MSQAVSDPDPAIGVSCLLPPVLVEDLLCAVRVNPLLEHLRVLLHLAIGHLQPPVSAGLRGLNSSVRELDRLPASHRDCLDCPVREGDGAGPVPRFGLLESLQLGIKHETLHHGKPGRHYPPFLIILSATEVFDREG